MKIMFALAVVCAAALCSCTRSNEAKPRSDAVSVPANYAEQTKHWQKDRDEYIRKQFVSIVGQGALNEGANTVGSGKDADIYVGDKTFPPIGAEFRVAGNKVTFAPRATAPAQVNGKPVRATIEVHSDADGKAKPDLITVRAFEMTVLERGGKFHVRVRNRTGEAVQSFTGLKFFEPDPHWIVRAHYQPHSAPKDLAVATSGNDFQTHLLSPGAVTLNINGQSLTLDVAQDEPDAKEFWLLFRDGTNGKETYPAGRYLYFDKPANGEAVLDFNRATNPPCASTPFGFCPLPPDSSRVNAEIAAGEKYVRH